jgi:ABC-type arginine/histidine transport system permease subunit
MTHNRSFRYHADMTTKGLGLGLALALGLWVGVGLALDLGLGLVLESAKVEVLHRFYILLHLFSSSICIQCLSLHIQNPPIN